MIKLCQGGCSALSVGHLKTRLKDSVLNTLYGISYKRNNAFKISFSPFLDWFLGDHELVLLPYLPP
jgi:hypothetical protein